MDVFEAIKRRRSIRKFRDTPVPRGLIERLLDAAISAPSGCNRQPWRFIVLQGERKDRLAGMLEARAEALRAKGEDMGGEIHTARIMKQAPVAVLVYNPLSSPGADHNGARRTQSLSNTQSVGAAIQNMLLAAEAVGLGTLWICDILIDDDEIGVWLGHSDELMAAVSIGYADEAPPARPRKPWQEVTEWR